MFRPASQTRFWLLAFILFAAVLWILRPILLPFMAGLAISYFLNPVVDALERRRIPRPIGALTMLAAFALILALIIVLILPLLQDQFGALINTIPDYTEKIRAHVIPWFDNWLTRFSPEDVQGIRNATAQYAGNVAGFAGKALQDVVTSGLALIDVIALLIITPVVAFYMMRDWPHLAATVNSLLPRRHYDLIRAQMSEVDRTLSGFVRGQALVCICLGCVYGIGLALAGLPYSAAIGVTAGVLTFIPYVGTGFAWIISIGLALVQFDSLSRISIVIAVLLLGHVLEAYILTPRFVGHRVGLHPVWILFALITGARLMGFTGILIAVPLAAVLGVAIRFAVTQYKNSALYKDPLAPNRP